LYSKRFKNFKRNIDVINGCPFLKKYLERYDANVISVDWEPLARSPWYTSAAKNSRLVGKYTAEFIKFLVEEGGSTYDSFHVLGASLGAHAAGFVGHYSEVCKVMSAQFFKLKQACLSF
jgi:hypothetical protein